MGRKEEEAREHDFVCVFFLNKSRPNNWHRSPPSLCVRDLGLICPFRETCTNNKLAFLIETFHSLPCKHPARLAGAAEHFGTVPRPQKQAAVTLNQLAHKSFPFPAAIIALTCRMSPGLCRLSGIGQLPDSQEGHAGSTEGPTGSTGGNTETEAGGAQEHLHQGGGTSHSHHFKRRRIDRRARTFQTFFTSLCASGRS